MSSGTKTVGESLGIALACLIVNLLVDVPCAWAPSSSPFRLTLPGAFLTSSLPEDFQSFSSITKHHQQPLARARRIFLPDLWHTENIHRDGAFFSLGNTKLRRPCRCRISRGKFIGTIASSTAKPLRKRPTHIHSDPSNSGCNQQGKTTTFTCSQCDQQLGPVGQMPEREKESDCVMIRLHRRHRATACIQLLILHPSLDSLLPVHRAWEPVNRNPARSSLVTVWNPMNILAFPCCQTSVGICACCPLITHPLTSHW
jgi:hypothetical protein